MKKILFLLLFVSSLVNAQSLNDYKYAIVPAKFEFQKSEDQYGLNSLAKMFMVKNGFETYLSTEVLPTDKSAEDCNKIYVDVLNKSSLLTTKLTVVLKDCRNAVLFTSKEGVNKLKDVRLAYNQALRDAFASLGPLNHVYNGSNVAEIVMTKDDKVVVKENVTSGTQPAVAASSPEIISAQEIENGFQLVDKTPKIVLVIYRTSQPEVFIAESGSRKGILQKKNGQWLFEFYQNGSLISEPMSIKF